MLMQHALGGSRAALIAAGPSPVPGNVEAAFEAMVARRLTREPLQHILAKAHFYGLEFRSDPRALIPRSDSEVVVETALSLVPEGQAAMIADLGTGSGCLLGAILANRPLATGVGVEADIRAAELARENLAALGLAGRASVFEGHWADWTGWNTASLIVSNPPYIESAEIGALEPEVRDHDPLAALDGGPDGLAAYRQLATIGAARLAAGAPLVLEIGHDQRSAVLDLLKASGFARLAHRLDLGGNDRCVWGFAPGTSG